MNGPPATLVIHWVLVLIAPSAWTWWKLNAGNAARMKRSLRRGDRALRSWFPGQTGPLFTIWTEQTQSTTAVLRVTLRSSLEERVPGAFRFDLDLPVETMRELRSAERRASCANTIGAPTPENFATFLRAHIRREDHNVTPADRDTLAMMQGVVWAECYASGWPVLCPNVDFVLGGRASSAAAGVVDQLSSTD